MYYRIESIFDIGIMLIVILDGRRLELSVTGAVLAILTNQVSFTSLLLCKKTDRPFVLIVEVGPKWRPLI